MAILIQTEPFDPGDEFNTFLANSDSAGGGVTFTGLVRSDPHDPITALTLECYPELARNQIATIEAEAVARFGLIRVTIIHRYGRLLPNEPIVQVMTLATHRATAFEGAQFLMDYLKTDAPFWKRKPPVRASAGSNTTPPMTRPRPAGANQNAATAPL